MLGKNLTTGRKSWKMLGSIMFAVAVSVLVSSGVASSATAGASYKTLHRFNHKDGYSYAGLTFDAAGNLYGTSREGETRNSAGIVFELTPNGDGSWKESVLHSFTMDGKDGYEPYANVTFDGAGNLYGTTLYGGTGSGCNFTGCGTVFELTPNQDGTWTESVLHSFNLAGADGSYPYAGLIFDPAGKLYGVTEGGGAYGGGTVFELTPNGDGSWKESILHSFNRDGKDGVYPYGGLLFDPEGNLYGTTSDGGAYDAYGTVFELTPNGDGTWKESVLHSFNHDGKDGYQPYAGVTSDGAGNLYATTVHGGANDIGTVFELSPNGGGTWKESILLSFDQADGSAPRASLILDSVGNIYGTASRGGTYNYGTVFKLKPGAKGAWTEKRLHSFKGSPGALPFSGLVADGQGILYGTTFGDGITTFGSVFVITP